MSVKFERARELFNKGRCLYLEIKVHPNAIIIAYTFSSGWKEGQVEKVLVYGDDECLSEKYRKIFLDLLGEYMVVSSALFHYDLFILDLLLTGHSVKSIQRFSKIICNNTMDSDGKYQKLAVIRRYTEKYICIDVKMLYPGYEYIPLHFIASDFVSFGRIRLNADPDDPIESSEDIEDLADIAENHLLMTKALFIRKKSEVLARIILGERLGIQRVSCVFDSLSKMSFDLFRHQLMVKGFSDDVAACPLSSYRLTATKGDCFVDLVIPQSLSFKGASDEFNEIVRRINGMRVKLSGGSPPCLGDNLSIRGRVFDIGGQFKKINNEEMAPCVYGVTDEVFSVNIKDALFNALVVVFENADSNNGKALAMAEVLRHHMEQRAVHDYYAMKDKVQADDLFIVALIASLSNISSPHFSPAMMLTISVVRILVRAYIIDRMSAIASVEYIDSADHLMFFKYTDYERGSKLCHEIVEDVEMTLSARLQVRHHTQIYHLGYGDLFLYDNHYGMVTSGSFKAYGNYAMQTAIIDYFIYDKEVDLSSYSPEDFMFVTWLPPDEMMKGGLPHRGFYFLKESFNPESDSVRDCLEALMVYEVNHFSMADLESRGVLRYNQLSIDGVIRLLKQSISGGLGELGGIFREH